MPVRAIPSFFVPPPREDVVILSQVDMALYSLNLCGWVCLVRAIGTISLIMAIVLSLFSLIVSAVDLFPTAGLSAGCSFEFYLGKL